MHTTSPNKRRRFILLAAVIICLLATVLLFVHARYRSCRYEAETFTESTAQLSNPYQGFLHMKGYRLSDEQPVTAETLSDVPSMHPETRLQMLQIQLSNYQNEPLSDNALAQLDLIFQAWSATNKQLIIRFLYDWNGKAKETEPNELATILQHMEQVGPVINRYADHIYILQGIFVGNCGEMNNSEHMKDMPVLIDKLAQVTDPAIYLSVRTPQHWRIINNVLDCPSPFPAFDDSLASRLGLFNDGMLGSGNDVGTYGDTPRAEATNPSYKGTRADELAFQDALCRYVPNGGEVVLECSFNDFENAVHDLSLMHVSYLSAAYESDVFLKWKNTIYTGEDCFGGCNGFDYIAAHLGYRFVLQDSVLSFDTWRDDTALLSFSIKNVGFANSLKAFPTKIILYNRETNEGISLDTGLDVRTLQCGETKDVSLSLPVRDLTQGEWDVFFQMTDVCGDEQILLANENKNTDDGYLLGRLQLR